MKKFAVIISKTRQFLLFILSVANITTTQLPAQELAKNNLPLLMPRGQEIELALSAAPERILAEEYKAGKLIAPRKPGVAYMLSPDFKKHDSRTGQSMQVFPPHVMFYAPYVKNADIGALPEHFNSDKNVFVLNEGRPDAYFIIVPKEHQHAPASQ